MVHACFALTFDAPVHSLGQVRQERGGPTITGRLSPAGVSASRVSVVLLSGAGRRGPESLDDEGRFGPWPVAHGDNTLRFTGLPDAPGRDVELRVSVVVDEPGPGQAAPG